MYRTDCAFLIALSAVLVLPAAAGAACAGKADGSAMVAEILDGATVRLDTGSVIRLAGIEPPGYRGEGNEDAASAMLKSAILSKNVQLRHSSARPDRYGRTVAQIFAGDDEDGWVQAQLVASGGARVMVTAEARPCAAELLRLEDGARRAGLGLWSDPAYAPAEAVHPSLGGQEHTYAIVEGKVLSANKSGNTVYLDFGRDWSRDFTATIEARSASMFDKAGRGADALRGKWVRIRGWITLRNGPAMRLANPETIELLDQSEDATSGGVRAGG